MNAELIKKWLSKGTEAGESDDRMAVENTLKGTVERCRDRRCTWVTSFFTLIWADINEWETTAHFHLLYGIEMLRDAKKDYVLFRKIKSEFWRGFLKGRKAAGIDIYVIAQELMMSYDKEWKKWAKER